MRRSLVGSKASAAFTRVLEDSPNSLSSKRLRNQPLSSLRYTAILPKKFEVSGPETEPDSVKLGPVSTHACALLLSVRLGSVGRMRDAPAAGWTDSLVGNEGLKKCKTRWLPKAEKKK